MAGPSPSTASTLRRAFVAVLVTVLSTILLITGIGAMVGLAEWHAEIALGAVLPLAFVAQHLIRKKPFNPKGIIGIFFALGALFSGIIGVQHLDGTLGEKSRAERAEREKVRAARQAEQDRQRAENQARLDQEAKEKAAREAAERAEREKKEAAELQALRKSDPDEYLKRLKEKDLTRWVEEAKVLRPKLYQAHLEAVRKQNEADEYTRQRKAPVDYLTLDFSWSKGGFESVMIADFTIKSTLQFEVRDIEILCIGSGNSGTRLARIPQTIYDVVPAKATKRFRGLNMGFIPQQMTNANCSIVGVKI